MPEEVKTQNYNPKYLSLLQMYDAECETIILKELPKETVNKITALKMAVSKYAKSPTDNQLASCKKQDETVCALIEKYVEDEYTSVPDADEEAEAKKKADDKNDTTGTPPAQKPDQVPPVAKTQLEAIESQITAKIAKNGNKRITKAELEEILGNPITERGDFRIGNLRFTKVIFKDEYYI